MTNGSPGRRFRRARCHGTGRGGRRALAALVGLAFLLLPDGSGAAPALGGFVASASAQGGRFSFTVPGFAAVEEVIDGGGPVSQAALDSAGGIGFASLPYPGETAVSFPGLAAVVTGSAPPFGYPFYVRAAHPTVPEQELTEPSDSYRLAATAAVDAATGAARMAWTNDQGSSGARATTSVKVDGTVVTASGETVNEALTFGGGALRIASARSRSVTTYTAGQPEPVTVTDLVIEGASAGGIAFSYGAGGLVVANQGVPIPAADGMAQINQALAPAGITVRAVGEAPVAGGRSADAFEVATTAAPPIPGVPPSVVRQRIGGATSAVLVGDSASRPDLPLPRLDEPVLTPDTGSEPAAAPGASPGTGTATDALAAGREQFPAAATDPGPWSAGGGFGRSTDLAATVPGSLSAADGAGPDAAFDQSAQPRLVGPVAAVQARVGPRELDALGWFYSVIVGAFVILLAGATAWQLKGVRR